jgi:uncharacterized protein (DUF885 family)
MVTVLVSLLVALLSLTACSNNEAPAPDVGHEANVPESSPETNNEDASSRLAVLSDEIWQDNLDSQVYVRLRNGLPLAAVPQGTYEEAAADAEKAGRWLSQLQDIDQNGLSHEEQLTAQVIEFMLTSTLAAEKFYWLNFGVTPYNGGFAVTFLNQAMSILPLATPEERLHYLEMLRQYANAVKMALAKLEGQAERGIRVPKDALPGVQATWEGIVKTVRPALQPAGARVESLTVEEQQAIEIAAAGIIDDEILPAFEALIAYLGDSYAEVAPGSVGLSQYPGGKEYYRFLTKMHTTRDITPEEVWAYGKSRMAEIQAEMASIRTQLGFEGTQAEFHDMIRTDPRFLAKTPQDVEDRFNDYIARIEPIVSQYFSLMPKAPYGVKRLDPAAEAGMTFGYYQAPTPMEARGLYRYNGSDLDKRSLIGSGPLIYHELIPGHHFHLALQNENTSLPMIRRQSMGFGAFNEGWAEYSAGLAQEMGLLDDPWDRYGRLVMDAFLTARLVVDPGMNYFGWSREQAMDYMMEHTMQSDLEIATETLRYSTDMPGQALAYKIGHKHILDQRIRAEEALGERFDIKEFHSAALGSGALGMDILTGHIDWYIENARAGD